MKLGAWRGGTLQGNAEKSSHKGAKTLSTQRTLCAFVPLRGKFLINFFMQR